MPGKEFINAIAQNLTALLTSLFQAMFGPGVHMTLFGDFTWADLGVLLCFVLAVLLVNGLVVRFLRRKIRQAEAHPEGKEWDTQFWCTAGRPLCVLTWVFCAYLVAAPLLMKLPVAAEPHPLRQLFDKLFDIGVFVVLFWFFFKSTRVIEARLKSWAVRTPSKFNDLLLPLLGRSLRMIVPVMGLILVLPLLGLSPVTSGVLAKGGSILIIGAVTWILLQTVTLGEGALMSRYDIKAADNLQARKIHTQVHVLGKTLRVIIGIFAIASVLMLFEEVRRFGTSILASAGVLGIIIGFAAQRTIANLFAGFQVAMTQPIRLDDVVVVENEWGRIEEITLTYVVVRIWDDRRLIVPLSYFIEKPFQNWTRMSANILGSVYIWADYTMPVSELRPAVERIVKSCEHWDRRFWNLQVTDTTDRAMQLRVLATAADASKAWDLRCEIREKLLAFLQEKFPQSLPKARASLYTTPDSELAVRPQSCSSMTAEPNSSSAKKKVANAT